MTTTEQLLTTWTDWMRSEGLAPRTIGHRTGTVAAFERRGLDILGADAEQLVRFLARQPVALSTRCNHYRVLRAWYLWLVRRGLRGDNPLDLIKPPKAPRGHPRPCSTEELGRALDRCTRRRTRMMLLLAAYEGLRVHEIAKIRGEDLRRGRLTIAGKGGAIASLPLHPLVAAYAAQMPRTGYWFPSYTNPGEPVRSQSVSEVVANALRRAGVDATAHQLRHWFGTEGLRSADGNLRVAQRLLRHACIATTQIYTLIDDAEMTAAVLALPRTA